ncbi:MAG: hypothetical protein JSS35_01465 [Proteobacteria bacterium]|nr:hypothetical protein [Pseudomonadota bacterium]
MRRALWVLFLLLTVAACQLAKPDPAAETTARGLYDDLRQGRDEALLSRMPAKMRTAPAQAELLRLRTLIPPGEPTTSKVVATSVLNLEKGGLMETSSIEYDYPGRASLLTAFMTRPSGASSWLVNTLQLHTGTDAQLARHRFTLSEKPPLQLAFLAYAIFVPLLMLGAVIKVVATPDLRHKWLWMVLSFIGLASLDMNWTTGALAINWYAIQVVGSGVSHGASRFDPWVLSATLPIGALLILGGLVANPRWARKPAGKNLR